MTWTGSKFREECPYCGARIGLHYYVRILERFRVVDYGVFSEIAHVHISCRCY